MGSTLSTAHRLEFCRALYLHHSNNKTSGYNVTSTAANKISQQWAVRFSTAHRLKIRRALYLYHSNNKNIGI